MISRALTVCVFDAYGTLFDVHSAVAAHHAAVGARADAVSTMWRQKQIEYSWLRSLMGAHADFWQLTQDALDYALQAYGISDAALREQLLSAYRTLRAYPDAPACLQALRERGRRMGILSNGSPDMLASAVSSAGLDGMFEAVLSVESVGVFKTAPRVYAMVPEKFKVAPEEVCFVSSNAWDVAGAAHFGFQVVWINRLKQPPENLPGRAKAEIASLAELPALF
jgi:2-haloacid dehalogenase